MTAVSGTQRLPQSVAIDAGFTAWAALIVLTLVCIVLQHRLPWVVTFPTAWQVPIAAGINVVSDAVVPVIQPLFRSISALLDVPMRGMQACLSWLPWPATMVIVVVLSLKSGGYRLALFSVIALGYMIIAGYWPQSMNTLALVLLAVPIAVGLGFALGLLGYRFPRFRPGLLALLDLMQTVPAFAYLIPLLLLFGFGPVVGLIASAIYATPPMVRNTILGLDRVPSDISEAGLMSGCTRRQQFWHVEVPTALPQMLVGFNQSTMAALSMVIVAAIIGGFEDIGWEVLSSMRKAEFGQSILSGLVIALLAMLIDRLTLGFAKECPNGPTPIMAWMNWRRLAAIVVIALVAAAAQRLFLPDAWALPSTTLREQVGIVNVALTSVVRDYAGFFNGARNVVLYSLLLPLRMGIVGAATPALWGFALTPPMIAVYVALWLAIAGLAMKAYGWQLAVATCMAGLLLFQGFAGFPWPALILGFGLLAYRLAGIRLACFAVIGFAFILVSGLSAPLGQSMYLTMLAVILCLMIGGLLGAWAAHSERVSKILRPICDGLQTVPQFVFLIPALMFFKVGEFTALIAIMLYAIVPPIRYVEHGLRNVRVDVVEAVQQMGATPTQVLMQAKFPLALPVIMLGINQTIMAALSMLAIAALVGTRDLGQQVYIALGKADAGLGIVAGLSIAFLAILADRLTQAGARQAGSMEPDWKS
ncbi:ABC transporter permease subunit [Mesorhizobium sp. M6A.T.Ce.TU.016.01.1.1]|uniref:ABC transporter permease n=1 Tax=Mesorhizobium sp. M6A.T.Ce.TU.016.01.1.1 TaxID=2496783 RepID=UPI000FCC1FFD|nr:ABC transporter permease subunit [Mesorhizobium sp. M6A.T.Ce.TU.016.01.1.1]RUU25061.1 ABC transporter permease subunit [Mesorhizobium sp. M6A.T.Ce.TU.016.01.1.1]